MRFLELKTDDPAICLATEEYLLSMDYDKDIFILWSGRPSVICGRFQNPLEEVSVAECKKKGIRIFRRCSGGGTVYHDHGNVNYSIISSRNGGTGYETFLSYAVGFLNSVGADAYPEGNMIKIGDFKISGNAQANTASRVLHHGTLLFDCDIEILSRLTRGSRSKFISKAIKSNPHPVCNIRPHLSSDISLTVFKKLFIEYMKGNDAEFLLDGNDNADISRLAEEKYGSWKWNFGNTPDFHISYGAVQADTHRGIFTEFTVSGRECPEMIGSRISIEESTEILSKLYPDSFDDILNAVYD